MFTLCSVSEHSQSLIEAKLFDGSSVRVLRSNRMAYMFYFELGLPERKKFRQMVLVGLKVIQ